MCVLHNHMMRGGDEKYNADDYCVGKCLLGDATHSATLVSKKKLLRVEVYGSIPQCF